MPHLTWIPQTDGAASIVSDRGHEVARYQFGPAERHPYFHPIRTLSGQGEPLTCHAPYDHPWHKAIWWSWKYINGLLFWEHGPIAEGQPQGIGVETSRQVEPAEMPGGEGVRLREGFELRAVSDQSVLMTESRQVDLMPSVPGVPGAWGIDWWTRFEARVDCELSATPWPEPKWGGYAGLNYRPNRCLAFDERIRNSHAQEGAKACHGTKALWAAYGGVLDGVPDVHPKHAQHAGVAMLDHPGNPGHPTSWYTASSGENNRAFGFLAAAPVMHGPAQLAAGEAWTFRYRIVVFEGTIPAGALDEAQAVFAQEDATRSG